MSTKKTGRIWQTADDIAQATEWAASYLAKGALHVELKPREPWTPGVETLPHDKLVDVIILIPYTSSLVPNPVLGYNIDREDWMIQDYPIGTNVFVHYDNGTIRAGKVYGRRTTELSPGSTNTEYFVQYYGENTQRYWVREDDVTDDAMEAAERLYAECTGG
jgi:hypothetical protein